MSNWYYLNSADPNSPPEPPIGTAFDYVTKLIVPAIGLVATIVALFRSQAKVMWALLAVTVLSLVAGFCPQLARRIRQHLAAWRDERTARRAFSALRLFVEQFGDFVSRQRSDTLHHIIESEVCGNRSDILAQFNLPSADIFQAWWSDISVRAAADRPEPASFKATAAQFGTLVALFDNHCMNAVFHRLPQDLKGKLSESSKSSLNLCQQRFNSFLEQYESFLNGLDRGFASRHVAIRSFSRVKPL